VGATYATIHDVYALGGVASNLATAKGKGVNATVRSVDGKGASGGVAGGVRKGGARIYNTYSRGDNVTGSNAGGIVGEADGWTTTQNMTVYCNAALVAEVTSYDNTGKPDAPRIYKVFDNDNSSTPKYGQKNWSYNGMTLISDPTPPTDRTVKVTDQYSSGTSVAPADYHTLFAVTMPNTTTGCGFNSDGAWNTAGTYPTLHNVGPTFTTIPVNAVPTMNKK
jgi:hypothetical protein